MGRDGRIYLSSADDRLWVGGRAEVIDSYAVMPKEIRTTEHDY